MFKPILKKYKDDKQDISILFKHPINDNSLFFLIYLYTKPEAVQVLDKNNSPLKILN